MIKFCVNNITMIEKRFLKHDVEGYCEYERL